ncbi:unnamed protein product [Symbiodinium necroappetens]|uniref:BTB domain-containing protein n=1 Tax=Symbiodinium necroappetens TaxID=1628268 RepID=A0A812M3I0_9DINO|nr:unnamed protein product [Symbiodinium necroappetens]
MAEDPHFDILKRFVNLADLAGLKNFAPPCFAWSRTADGELPLLFEAFKKGVMKHDSRKRCLQIVEWMIKNGADPFLRLPQKLREPCAFQWYRSKRGEKEKDMSDEIRVQANGQCLLSFALALLEALDETEKGRYVGAADFVQEVVSIVSRMQGQRPKIEVDQTAIDRWEAIRNMTATHNVTFATADGPVTAHDIALIAASPVLSAMLQSCMTEGSRKHIQVKDSSAAGVSLFLDLVYASSTCSEVQYKTALEALDLAHRWQVEGVVRVLEEILQGMITDSSFVDIASAATLKSLFGLEKACATFAQNSKALQRMSQNGELPPALKKLLGHAAMASDTSAPKKRRRSF